MAGPVHDRPHHGDRTAPPGGHQAGALHVDGESTRAGQLLAPVAAHQPAGRDNRPHPDGAARRAGGRRPPARPPAGRPTPGGRGPHRPPPRRPGADRAGRAPQTPVTATAPASLAAGLPTSPAAVRPSADRAHSRAHDQGAGRAGPDGPGLDPAGVPAPTGVPRSLRPRPREPAEGHHREDQAVQVVVDVEVARKARPGVPGLVPRSFRPLGCHQPVDRLDHRPAVVPRRRRAGPAGPTRSVRRWTGRDPARRGHDRSAGPRPSRRRGSGDPRARPRPAGSWHRRGSRPPPPGRARRRRCRRGGWLPTGRTRSRRAPAGPTAMPPPGRGRPLRPPGGRRGGGRRGGGSWRWAGPAGAGPVGRTPAQVARTVAATTVPSVRQHLDHVGGDVRTRRIGDRAEVAEGEGGDRAGWCCRRRRRPSPRPGTACPGST